MGVNWAKRKGKTVPQRGSSKVDVPVVQGAWWVWGTSAESKRRGWGCLAGQVVQAFAGCEGFWTLYWEQWELWKDLNPQVIWTGLHFQQSLLATENGGMWVSKETTGNKSYNVKERSGDEDGGKRTVLTEEESEKKLERCVCVCTAHRGVNITPGWRVLSASPEPLVVIYQ